MVRTTDREPFIPRKKVEEIDIQFHLKTVKTAKWLAWLLK